MGLQHFGRETFPSSNKWALILFVCIFFILFISSSFLLFYFFIIILMVEGIMLILLPGCFLNSILISSLSLLEEITRLSWVFFFFSSSSPLSRLLSFFSLFISFVYFSLPFLFFFFYLSFIRLCPFFRTQSCITNKSNQQ